ncbi:phosphoglycolate phosphatase [Bordetella sp. J329]|jgi:phosphoglycolate phosphatase|uniref:HAD family hydrolase n=1 Tax=Kerstersia gyiorum TaxID=206506 RepID=UPI000FDC64DF|nr:HAD-IA family hydrolase [Kerstersia gyiorum]AZV94369.1 phosphoglycolate phosphatase [Bordetella sp. J329]MCH4271360.1 HAD-IA family hydrolase [Kerstersia gyiorum]MCI1229638.1 HAD-IA family hydrolase [Kerstersia gyiorum]
MSSVTYQGLVLFDFDGTLADSAPDLAEAANQQRRYRGLADLPYEALRPVASQGAPGLLRVALGLDRSDTEFEAARQRFLADYAACMTERTDLFPDIPELLANLEQHGLGWGIVTNKVERLALPIIEHLDLMRRSAATVCGDTCAYAKPHPEPVSHAIRLAGYQAQDTIYVGDDERDIIAGREAGTRTIAVGFGYCDPAQARNWGADLYVEHPGELWDAVLELLPRQ